MTAGAGGAGRGGRPRKDGLVVHNNRHGFRGVEFDRARNMFRARIEPETGRRGKWLGRFASAEEAAFAYDKAAREIYGDRAALNFPGAGEVQAIATQRPKGLCPQGHDMTEHGYVRPDGRGQTCRLCQRAVSARYYARTRNKMDPRP